MKKIALFLALVTLIGLLCACSPKTEEPAPEAAPEVTSEEVADSPLTGTWIGDGSMDIYGLDHEIEFVHTWTFRNDGTATAEKTLDNGTEEVLDYNYKYTEDTLTFEKDGATCGIGYTIEDNVMTIRTGVKTYATFTRQ